MTALTQSGYEVVDDYGSPLLVSNPVIPGTGGVKVLGGLRKGDPATVLLYVATCWYQTVEQYVQSDGVWGYDKRDIRGGSGWSNHAGGVAIDIAAAKHPQGTDTMTVTKETAVRKIVARVNGWANTPVLDWGGEWLGSTRDQMHVQLHANVNRTALAHAADVITSGNAFPLGPGQYFGYGGVTEGAGVIQIQQRLNFMGFNAGSVDGYVGAKFTAAVKRYQATLNGKVTISGRVGPITWKNLFQ